MCFMHSLRPNKSAVCYIMLANFSLPSYMMIHVKCCQDILHGSGVLTNKVTANATQNSLSDSEAADDVCVFDD